MHRLIRDNTSRKQDFRLEMTYNKHKIAYKQNVYSMISVCGVAQANLELYFTHMHWAHFPQNEAYVINMNYFEHCLRTKEQLVIVHNLYVYKR